MKRPLKFTKIEPETHYIAGSLNDYMRVDATYGCEACGQVLRRLEEIPLHRQLYAGGSELMRYVVRQLSVAPPDHECTMDEMFGPLDNMAQYLYNVSATRGYQSPPPTLTEIVAKLHEEVSELYQAHCRGTLDNPCDKAHEMEEAGLRILTCREEECADIFIRLAMAVKELGVQRFADCVRTKDAFNRIRKLKPRPAP